MKRGHFNVWEYVPKALYTQHGEQAWRFVDVALLNVMNRLRDNLAKSITANTWKANGRFQWRGVRTSSYSGFSMTSQHAWGRALDFDVRGMTAKDVIRYVLNHVKDYPEITFIEIDQNWVHIDVGLRPNYDDKVMLWSPSRGYVDVDTYLGE